MSRDYHEIRGDFSLFKLADLGMAIIDWQMDEIGANVDEFRPSITICTIRYPFCSVEKW